MRIARDICFKLPMQVVRIALSLALDNAGKSIAARMAMIAITTSNSINVKPALSDNAAVLIKPARVRAGARLARTDAWCRHSESTAGVFMSTCSEMVKYAR